MAIIGSFSPKFSITTFGPARIDEADGSTPADTSSESSDGDSEDSSLVYIAVDLDSDAARAVIIESESGDSSSAGSSGDFVLGSAPAISESIREDIVEGGLSDAPSGVRDAIERQIEEAGRRAIELAQESAEDPAFSESDAGRADSQRRLQSNCAESSRGSVSLKEEEKPKIVAAFMGGKNRFGYPTKNVLFIKRLSSPVGIAKSYKILRKKIFEEDSFSEVAELSSDRFNITPEYEKYISRIPYNRNHLFMWVDSSLHPDSVYVYRLVVDWDLASEEEVERRNRIIGSLNFDAASAGVPIGIQF